MTTPLTTGWNGHLSEKPGMKTSNTDKTKTAIKMRKENQRKPCTESPEKENPKVLAHGKKSPMRAKRLPAAVAAWNRKTRFQLNSNEVAGEPLGPAVKD